eukprot:m.43424 g.43424  ORF g.43424 m.43424 type:complete len:671 (-) comp5781_c0_seq1:1113-3125(-)
MAVPPERDVAKLRRQAEDKLQADTLRCNAVHEGLQKSQEVTKKMVSVLSSFGERLSNLESVIRPVHMETMNLTRARDTMRQTMQLLQDIESFHEVSTKSETILQQSPSHQLDSYLSTMDTVRKAVIYFEDHNPAHPEKTRLTRLQNTGYRFLEHEFHQVLERHSFAIEPDKLLEMPDESVSSALVLSADVVETLHKIANWLTEADTTAEMIRSMAKVRSNVVTATLAALSDGSSPPKEQRNPRLSMAFPSAKGSALKRQASTSKKGGSAAAAPDAARKADARSALDMETENRPGAYVRNSHPFITYTRVLLRLLRREALLAAHIVKENLVGPLLRNVLGPVMDTYISQGELLVGSIGRKIAAQNFFACLCVFDMIAYMSTKQTEFEKIIKYLDGNDCVDRFLGLLHNFIELAKTTLQDFQSDILADSAVRLPADGTVHEATSNVLGFMMQVHEYAEVVGNVLLPRREDTLSFAATPESSRALGKYLASVLDTLQVNLARASRQYEHEALRAVFLMNNYDYLLRFLATAPFRDLVLKQNAQLEDRLRDDIQSQRQDYLGATWHTFRDTLALSDYHEGNITKKEKEDIKTRYTRFNDDFDRTVHEQQAFSVPNEQLRQTLRQANTDLLLPLFKRFDMHYRHSGFSAKNPQKYLRFTPDEVQERLSTFFEGIM